MISSLANTPVIKKMLQSSNLSYAYMKDEVRNETIRLRNKKWKTVTDPVDELLLEYTDNSVSRLLKNQQAN